MDWPRRPIEQIPAQSVRPPHCPWPSCSAHRPSPERPFHFHRHGVFLPAAARGQAVPRFRCRHCRRTFSRQSFAFSYYLKRPELSVPIAAGLMAGSAHRQLARSLGCAPSTVTRRAARLGRHTLLLSTLALAEVTPVVGEAVVLDHFEGFAFSQDCPFGLATPVGQDSWFVYGLDAAPHRRTGRLSPAQRRRLRHRPVPALSRGSYDRSFGQVVDLLLGRAQPGELELTLVTDGHPAYERARAGHPHRERIRHRAYPNPRRGPKGSPRSPEARERDRQMFPVDLLHGLIRHSCAHHRRETIAFGRRLNALLERAFVMVVWRNFVKSRSERRGGTVTPAMKVGLAGRSWSWPRVLAQRLFPSRVDPPATYHKIYRRDWITPAVGVNARHRLKNAY